MRKTYQKPLIVVVETELTLFVCESQDITSNNGITYGGVDEDGDIDPASRRRRDMWDEEEDEE
jgi:hypothetical protein